MIVPLSRGLLLYHYKSIVSRYLIDKHSPLALLILHICCALCSKERIISVDVTAFFDVKKAIILPILVIIIVNAVYFTYQNSGGTSNVKTRRKYF